MNKIAPLTLLVLFAVTLTGCCCCVGSRGAQNPPHVGAFLKEGRRYVEMGECKGQPGPQDTAGLPTAASRRPLIVLWYPEANLDMLVLVREPRGSVAYNATPKGEDVYEIRPRSDLEDGLYCLTQGNPLLPNELLPRWCFCVGKGGQ